MSIGENRRKLKKYKNRVCPKCNSPLEEIFDHFELKLYSKPVNIGEEIKEKSIKKLKTEVTIYAYGFQCGENHKLVDHMKIVGIYVPCPNSKCDSNIVKININGKTGLACKKFGKGCFVRIKKPPFYDQEQILKIYKRFKKLRMDWTYMKPLTKSIQWYAFVRNKRLNLYRKKKTKKSTKEWDEIFEITKTKSDNKEIYHDPIGGVIDDQVLELKESYVDWGSIFNVAEVPYEKSPSKGFSKDPIPLVSEETIDINKKQDSHSKISLKDNYEHIRKLGTGGFAEVYLVKDARGERYALKVPKKGFEGWDNKKICKDFLKEAEHWSKLHTFKRTRKGVVEIFEYGLEPEPYILMEYMNLGNLRSRMKNLNFDQKLNCISSLLNTLHVVHHLGVIHRDIKPENILYNINQNWKITDWGLSKVLIDDTSTKSTTIKATLSYASPEQIDPTKFGNVDWRSDLYQVGAIAYELFTGKKVFSGSSSTLLYSIVRRKPEKPSSIDPWLPDELSRTIEKSLSKNKEKRWQSAREFKMALFGKM